MIDPSRIERTFPRAPRSRIAASLLFGRERASMYVAYLLGVVVSAAAFGVPDMVSAASLLSGQWNTPQSIPLGTQKAPLPSDNDAPFDEAEETTDPSESSRSEERPESDGEEVFVDGRGVVASVLPDVLHEPVGSPRPAHEVAMESQFHPDGLERPPRV